MLFREDWGPQFWWCCFLIPSTPDFDISQLGTAKRKKHHQRSTIEKGWSKQNLETLLVADFALVVPFGIVATKRPILRRSHMAVGQNPIPLVNIKGGKWMFIHPKMEPQVMPHGHMFDPLCQTVTKPPPESQTLPSPRPVGSENGSTYINMGREPEPKRFRSPPSRVDFQPFSQGSLHYTPGHCLVVSLYFGGKIQFQKGKMYLLRSPVSRS